MAAPVKVALQRFAFLFLVLAAFALMLVGKAENLMVERLRGTVTDAVAPVVDMLSRPAATVADAVQKLREVAQLRSANIQLRADLARLQHWEATARQLRAENAELRALLNQAVEPAARFVTARVIADVGGAFVRSVVVNAGSRDGVAKDHAVITGDGLAGRVVIAGERSARVLLVTDLNSNVPVVIERTRARAILQGDNGDQPRLAFLPANASVTVGDRIVTSGHGGIFPAGLPVGVVVTVTDGIPRVRPFAAVGALEFVRVVDYPQTVPPDENPDTPDAAPAATSSATPAAAPAASARSRAPEANR